MDGAEAVSGSMPGARFTRYQLRSTDPGAARKFYDDVMGASFWSGPTDLTQLPARAAARGAPAHWLGHLGVPDFERTVGRFVALGGEHLGATDRSTNGPPLAVVRDPFGAVLAIVEGDPSREAVAREDIVAWHLLLTGDEARAFAWYHDLFGWTETGVVDLGGRLGRHQRFRWGDTGPVVGSVAKAARPQVHPQWLFCFEIADVAQAVERVRPGGGNALDATATPEGDLVSPCEDPQGAAFALYQRRRH